MEQKDHLELEVQKIESDVLPIARAATSYEIVDQETMEGAVNFLGKVKEARDRVENTRKFFTKPLLDLKKVYDAKFNPTLSGLETAEQVLKTKMTEYRLTLPENSVSTTRTSDAKATFVKVWRHRVVDAALVPREYLCVDESKISHVVKAGMRTIPGVEVYEEEQVRAGYVG